MTALLLVLALTAAPHRFTAADATQLFEAGNAAYFKGDYGQAAGTYQKLIDDGWQSADVQYNLGTALLAEGKLGRAVLSLERARRLAPGDEDIQANLERARHEGVDKVAGAGEEPFASRVASLVPVRLTGWVFLGAWAAFWLALLAKRWARGAALALAAVAGLCVVVAGGLLGVQWFARTRLHQAVVVDATVKAREGPSAASKVSFELHPGTELRIIERDQGFVRVRLHNGLEGWAQAAGVEEI